MTIADVTTALGTSAMTAVVTTVVDTAGMTVAVTTVVVGMTGGGVTIAARRPCRRDARWA